MSADSDRSSVGHRREEGASGASDVGRRESRPPEDALTPGREELALLRRRLAELPDPSEFSHAENDLAHEICELHERIVRAIGAVEACRSCAGQPVAGGVHELPGGSCCDQRIAKLFRRTELTVLRASGCDPDRLEGPGLKGAGCVFRDRGGCTLPPKHRPSPCIAYVCELLGDELQRRGDLDAIRDDCRRLEDLARRLGALGSMRSVLAELQALV